MMKAMRTWLENIFGDVRPSAELAAAKGFYFELVLSGILNAAGWARQSWAGVAADLGYSADQVAAWLLLLRGEVVLEGRFVFVPSAWRFYAEGAGGPTNKNARRSVLNALDGAPDWIRARVLADLEGCQLLTPAGIPGQLELFPVQAPKVATLHQAAAEASPETPSEPVSDPSDTPVPDLLVEPAHIWSSAPAPAGVFSFSGNESENKRQPRKQRKKTGGSKGGLPQLQREYLLVAYRQCFPGAPEQPMDLAAIDRASASWPLEALVATVYAASLDPWRRQDDKDQRRSASSKHRLACLMSDRNIQEYAPRWGDPAQVRAGIQRDLEAGPQAWAQQKQAEAQREALESQRVATEKAAEEWKAVLAEAKQEEWC